MFGSEMSEEVFGDFVASLSVDEVDDLEEEDEVCFGQFF